MHTLTPKADEAGPAPSPLERLARLHTGIRQRRLLGVRVSAILEVLSFVGIALAIDLVWGQGLRFAGVMPHPFWIPVLLAASYYGVREGLFAAALCAFALLYGNFPARVTGEGGYAWLLRATREPWLWLITALVLGEIRDAFRRRSDDLREKLETVQERLESLTHACDRLTRQKEGLEARIASQSLTVHAMYSASRAVERDGVGDVLSGLSELVRASLSPKKFSLYLLHAGRLEAAVSEGWLPRDRYARVFDSQAPLLQAMTSRRHLVVVDPDDEALLKDEGLLAGPIINGDDRSVIGMLKIEAMDFLDLSPSTVRNFRMVCDWIGAAITQAQRLERLREPTLTVDTPHLVSAQLAPSLRVLLQQLAVASATEMSVIAIELRPDNPGHDPRIVAQLEASMDEAARALQQVMPMCLATTIPGQFEVILPRANLDAARPLALRFVTTLRQALESRGVHAMLRHRVQPLIDVRKAA